MKQTPEQLLAKIARRFKIPFDRLPADHFAKALRQHQAEVQFRQGKAAEELKELSIQIKETIESLEAAEELVQIVEVQLKENQKPMIRNSLLMKHTVAINKTIRYQKRLSILSSRFVVLALEFWVVGEKGKGLGP